MKRMYRFLIIATIVILLISTAQALTVTISAKNGGGQTYLMEKSENAKISAKGSVDFGNLNIEHSSSYNGVNSSYELNVQGVEGNVKKYEINSFVKASSVKGEAKLGAKPDKAKFSNSFKGENVQGYASSTKSDARVVNNDPCDAPRVVGSESKETAKVSLDSKGNVTSIQKAEFDGKAKVYSKTTIEGKYGYSAAWASKDPDNEGEWTEVRGGWWSYELWIKGKDSASTWAKFTDGGMLKTEFYAEVGDTAKSHGNAFVKDESPIDYGNAHYGKTDGDIYVTAENIWCGNLDAFVVSHSLNNHSSATLAGIEKGNLNSTLYAETGSFTHANFTTKSSAMHNEIYSISDGKEYKHKYYWDRWNPWNPSANSKKEVDANGFGFSNGNETNVKLDTR